MRRSTQAALAAGYNVLRPNVRNCGGTEHLSPTLYHSGLTWDLRCIVDELAPAPLYILGFSMGGNIALKLAGEWGDEAPPHVRGDLRHLRADPPRALCTRTRPSAQLRLRVALHEDAAADPCGRSRRLMPERYGAFSTGHIRSIYEFDEHVTAPAFGFRKCRRLLRECSCASFLPRVRVPSLLIHSDDDPFIPPDTYADPVFEQNPYVKLLRTRYGGHVAFLSRRGPVSGPKSKPSLSSPPSALNLHFSPPDGRSTWYDRQDFVALARRARRTFKYACARQAARASS